MVLCVTLGRQHVEHHNGLVGLHHRLVHHAGHPDRLVARLGQPVVLLVLRLFRQLDASLFVQLRCSICCWDVTFIYFSNFVFLCLLVFQILILLRNGDAEPLYGAGEGLGAAHLARPRNLEVLHIDGIVARPRSIVLFLAPSLISAPGRQNLLSGVERLAMSASTGQSRLFANRCSAR